MVFYIFPPNGNISLANIEDFLIKRMTLALKISKCNGNFNDIRQMLEEVSVVTNCECLIEGSRKDQISHFLLRLTCADHPEMSEFLMKSECSLFMYRLSCMTESELLSVIVKPLKKLHRKLRAHFSENKGYRNVSAEMGHVFEILQSVTCAYTWEGVVSAYIDGANHNIVVPFQCVLDLVSQRLVILKKGMAFVPCSKFPEILKSMFILLLRHGLRLAKQQLPEVKEDCRIRNSLKKIQRMYGESHGVCYTEGMRALNCEDVDQVSESFPLCMSSLHKALRETHRLRHNARIQYTLFLKEVGLPLHEAVNFWRSEYSKPPSSCAPKGKAHCGHHWEKDGQRYTYSIRHLYGLEGRRVNYRGHCCASLQSSIPGPLDQGGCPFKTNDITSLRKLLTDAGVKKTMQWKICELVGHGSLNEACLMYMERKLRWTFPGTKYKQQQVNIDDHSEKRSRVDPCFGKLPGGCVKAHTNPPPCENLCDKRHQDLKSIKCENQLTLKVEDQRTHSRSAMETDLDHLPREIVRTDIGRTSSEENHVIKVKHENDLVLNVENQQRNLITAFHSSMDNLTVENVQVDIPGTVIVAETTASRDYNAIKIKEADKLALKIEASLSKVGDKGCRILPEIQQSMEDLPPSQNCYQHDTCPSSQSQVLAEGDSICLQKPLQYFLSYQRLKSQLLDISCRSSSK